MEMYYGFFQSAIRGWKPLLNVDVAHKAFPQGLEVLDLICDLGSDNRYRMERHQIPTRLGGLALKMEKFLKTLKIKYEIPNQPSSKRIYRVNGLGEAAANAKFKQEDGTVLTVADYFARQKRIQLRYPQLPTLWVGSRDRTPKILLPIEFCSIESGQAVNRKMTEKQTSAMIKEAATSTVERKRKIMDALNTTNYNNDLCIREFGFSVGNQFEQLQARVLTPPTLEYAREFQVTPSKGVWRNDKSHFWKGATIENWTIAYATRYPPKYEELSKMVSFYFDNFNALFSPRSVFVFFQIFSFVNFYFCLRFTNVEETVVCDLPKKQLFPLCTSVDLKVKQIFLII